MSCLEERSQERPPGLRPVGLGQVVFSPDCRPERHKKRKSTFNDSVPSVLESTYPLKLLIPDYASSSSCQWVYPITYGGGLVEGDIIRLSVTVEEGCSVLLTTQAATKVYHCPGGGETQQVLQHFVRPGALLALIPDPLVPFQDSIFSQTQKVDLSVGGNLILLDWLTAGRTARGEVWDFTRVSSSNQVSIGGKTVLRDMQSLSDSPLLSLKQAMGAYSVLGVLILLGPSLEKLSEQLLITLGKPKAYDAKYDCENLMAASPLYYRITELEEHGSEVNEVKGCIIKFATATVSKAYHEVENLLRPMFDVLGGNPFDGKH